MKRFSLIFALSSFAIILFGQLVPGFAQTPPAKQHSPQAQAHSDKALTFADHADWNGAIAEYQAAYALDKEAYPDDAARDLAAIGICYSSLSQYDKALSSFQQALAIFQQLKDTDGQARALESLGSTYNHLHQFDKAIDLLQQALPLSPQVTDINTEASTVSDLGDAYLSLSQYDKALSFYQQASVLYLKAEDPDGQALALNNLGSAYQGLNQYDKAIIFFQKALTIDQHIKDQTGQADTLTNLGNAYFHLSRNAQAIGCYQQALVLYQELKDTDRQARMLDNLGNAYTALNQYDKAIRVQQQALALFQQLKDTGGQAKALDSLGNAYQALSQDDKATSFYQQALPLFQQVKDTNGQADVLDNMGTTSLSRSKYEEAMSFYQQALALFQQIKDTDGQAKALDNLGNAYQALSQDDKAISFYQQALPLFQQVKDTNGQAGVLINLGNAHYDLSQDEKAIDFYQQALPLFQQLKNRDGQASALTNMGSTYQNLSQYEKAIAVLQQALPLFQQIKNTDGQASVLNNIGTAYFGLSQDDKAIQYFQEASPLFQQIQDREGEASSMGNLMRIWSQDAKPRLAIFYGKQAVNVYQSIRQDNRKLDKDTQKAYLKDKEPTYRILAELLIAQGRLPEAEQVLNLLKNQEFFDFVQRDAANAPEAGQASLTPVENTWQTRYQAIADHVTAIGQTKSDLLTKQQQADQGQITLTPTQKADLQHNLTQADADLTVANKAFQDFLTQLTTESQNAPKLTQDRVQTVTDAAAFEDTLSQLGPGTVALYTIVEPDKVRILVVTSQTQVAREYPIKDTELRAKVLAFRQVLQDPTRDPRPLAHELYTILMGPIERDLQGAQATTLMWSLDDVLRYVPMAALYDGKQYLVEHYKNEVFTPASESRLTETPKAEWNGLGLGVSLAHDNFPALTGVPQELDDVIHDPTVTASQTGALPGTILLDTAFTQQAMTQALEERKYPLVHIASHFDFQPGDETDSFLLLGDGGHLTLADIKTLPQVFQGVDLLTLSACDTADGSTGADGREVEGFAVLAQRLGAKAVIASLWPVADASTPLLMETFYRQHAAVPGQPKAEALRQAQLALLHGTVSAPATGTQRAQIVPGKSDKSVVDAPVFTPDPKVPFAHPYYWAPFILIGNWK